MVVNHAVTASAITQESATFESVPDLLIVDWSNIVHRTFHSMGADPELLARDICLVAEQSFREIAAGILYAGFRVAIVIDGGHSGRRDIFIGYKGNRTSRDERPPALVTACDGPTREQRERLAVVQMYGYEADDVMAALANLHPGDSYILTNDRDLLQAVNNRVRVLCPKGQFDVPELFGPEEVIAKYGFPPSKIPEYKALQGDPTDAVPSIPGIGHGKAMMLVNEYGGIDGAISAAKRGLLTPKLTSTLILYADSIARNLQLVTLVEVPGIADVYEKIVQRSVS